MSVNFPQLAQQLTGERRQRPPVVDTRPSKSKLIVAESSRFGMPDLSETAYIPESINWQVLTPARAAKVIASANAHLSPALVVVRSWTPVGRSGRKGWGYRHTSFVMVDGDANLLQHRRVFDENEPGKRVRCRHNGGCQVCGNIHADYVLTWCLAPDGFVLACDACAHAHLLHPQDVVSPFYWPGVGARPGISAMCEYAEPAYAYRIFVDLTGGIDVEVSAYADVKDLCEFIDQGIDTLRAWVREHSLMPTLEEAAVTLPWRSGENHPIAVMRSEAGRMAAVLGGLAGVGSFKELVETIRGGAR